MFGIERAGDFASCGTHANTGSSTVFVDGRGVTRAAYDTVAGTTIIGGATTVLVEGFPVSIPGDTCGHPSDSPHSNATTANPSTTVLIGVIS
jgi:uncharacterized Zn-binding protein involved in type VI secretion|tara:strand:- start:266 stop:541 length:276 start_codon:yes stop_codon:yes gene_type:complete